MLKTFDLVPVNKYLGMKLVSRSASVSEVSLEILPEYLQEGGVVHGGIVSTVADSAAVYLFLPELDEGTSMTSIEFKMNFLRPARLGAGRLIARARSVKRGRTVYVAEVEVEQGGAEVARGLFTYLVIRPLPSDGGA